MLTRAEACNEMRMSLSTLDRRIAVGDLKAIRGSHGRRRRVYVMLTMNRPTTATWRWPRPRNGYAGWRGR